MDGGAGVDTYVFNLGDGDRYYSGCRGGRQPTGVRCLQSRNRTLRLGLGSFLVRVGSNGDAIHIQGFDPADPPQSAGIDDFEFADGTTLTHTELIARGFDLVGTAGDDVLNGGETYRGIFGLDGDDALTGGAIDNVLDGGDGNDVIVGNGGVDQLSGGTGDDIMQGGDGNDVLKGDAGNDRLEGEAGDDTIDAGTGDDLVNAGAGNDTVLGGEGNDTIFAGTGDDTAAGGAGDDTVYGQGGTDVVDGGTGNDLFVGAPGSYSYAFGTGSGHDIIDSSQGGSYIIQMSAGVLPSDVIVGRVDRTITLSLNGGFDTLTLPSFYENHSFHVQFADKTVWDANSIHNQAGDSLQVGTKGSDFILGYNGFPDELIGLAGDDGYAVNDLGDVVVEAPDEGHDGVVSTVDFTLPDNVEDLTLSDPFALYDLVGPVVLHVDPAAVFATGNALNNVLSGNSFDNVLTGGAGDDTLNGGQLIYGNLISTHNDDTLTGGPGNDTYYFSAFYGGVDTIIDQSSTGESNTLIFSDLSYFGSDPLAGFHLRLDGTTLVMQMDIHPFSIVENTREVRFPNFNPNDAYGSHAIDVFDFQDGTLLSYQQIIDLGIDVQGTSQDDIVTGTNAPNRIHGGAGDDTLLGGPRNDIYLFDRGDGVDTIVDTAVAGAMNEIRFGTGLSLGDLEVVQEANSLTIQTGPNGDTIVLSNYDPAGQTGSSVIGSITFTNGLHLSLDELVNFSGGTDGNDTFSGTDGVDRYNAKGGNDVVTGGGGNDLLLGGSGQDDLKGDTGNDQLFGGYGYDTLTGGIGDDTIDGGAGADVYVFNPGDGHDVILDRADSGGNNRLLFGPGITLSDLLFNQDYGGQFGISINGINIIINGIYVGSNGDRIDLPNFRDVPPGLHTISFADGLTLDLFDYYAASLVEADQILFAGPGDDALIGGAGNDTLHGGTGSSVLIGGGGNNTLIGGSGSNMFYGASEANNTVFFGTGSNVLVIPGGSSRNTVHALGLPGSNSVVFGGDYDSFNPNLSFGFGSLLIRYGSEGGELHIAGFDPNGAYANPGIGTFQFTDRTLTYQELIDLGFDISGNNEANVLTGSSATDRIKGLGGNDTLQSGLGADVLEGGQGDDLLSGGMGNDTYVFNLGDGIDTIQDVASTGEGNRIQFGSGISQADLTFTQDEVAQTLTIQVGSSGTDKLLLTNFDLTGANGSLVVDTLAFADGSTAQLAALLGTTDAITGTPSNDVLTGTSGNDTIIGGFGNDTLSGGTGDDTYVFNGGDGIDTIVDTAVPGEGNTLQFGTGITAADLSLGVGSLLIRVGTNGDALHLTNFDPANVLGPRTIETFQFADGTTLSYDQLIAWGFDLTGTAGNDTLTGTNVVDRISGLAGDDTLQGGVGADTLVGGNGNDTYVVDNAGDAVTENLNEGTDTVQSSLTYVLGANVENLILTGASAHDGTGNELNNVLIGNDSANVLVGGDGNDRLLGNAGNDILNGGIGLDTLSGGNGDDLLYIDADDTSINGGLGHDSVFVLPGSAGATLDVATANIENAMGGNGNDTFTGTNATVNLLLQGNSGNDTLLGGAGIDALNGGSGNDLLNGGAGADILVGGTGDDTYVVDDPGDQLTENLNEGTDTAQSSISYTLGANVENITLTGTANLSSVGNGLSNVLIGNSGDTVLDGGAGADTLIGGLGNDTYLVDNTGDVVTEQLNEGTDTVQSAVTYMLGANVENLTLTSGAAINGTGNSLNNVLIGNSASNTLTGGAGNDTLDGGVGNDTLVGGAGNDTYLVDARSDVVIELANGGTDQVRSRITYTLGSNLENLTLTSMSAINGTGNAFDNILTGNSGANVLTGGAGNDTYLVGAGDTVVENASGGTDTVQSSVAWTLSLNVENLALTGTANINGTGNSANNVLIGNSGNNTLNGGSGNDTVDGGDGNDSLLGGSGDDTLLGGLGNDTLNAGSGNDVLNGGDGTDALDGGSGDDQLLGGAGNDTVTGGSGADQFTGGTGNDTLTGDSGNDLYNFSRGDGQDTIIDSDPFPGNQDRALFGATINPLDLVISRQANDLRLAIHGSSDQITVQNWYVGTVNRIETIQAGNGQTLLSTQVDQLIQAMAGFTAQTGLTWDQAIDQQPQDVQAILAASWQSNRETSSRATLSGGGLMNVELRKNALKQRDRFFDILAPNSSTMSFLPS